MRRPDPYQDPRPRAGDRGRPRSGCPDRAARPALDADVVHVPRRGARRAHGARDRGCGGRDRDHRAAGGGIPEQPAHDLRRSTTAATVAQMRNCMAVGNVVAGVICADGHLGYAQPVGGVIAYEKQISISGVGFDIGCGNMAVRLDTPFAAIEDKVGDIIKDVSRVISFGVGRSNEERVEHELFDDGEAWKRIRHGGVPAEGGRAARHGRIGQPLCRPDARRGRLGLDRRAFRQPRPRPHQRHPLSQGGGRQGRHERAAGGDRRGQRARPPLHRGHAARRALFLRRAASG